ncbi:MAG: protein kinase [Acidobacteriota bacterium]
MTSRRTDAFVPPDRFELDREIGRGGMAVVYRAHDRHLGRFVAIKVLSPELSGSAGTERFQREITLTARLVHPGIVALFDSGVADGRLFYVMPLVSGETLRARVSRGPRMPPQEAAALGADLAEALAYAHGLGVVHRDIKPENVFVVAGRAVLADFGIARVVNDLLSDRGDLTVGGMLVGTVAYMSPEQAGGDPDVDGRSDLYSLGCMLYEMLTGMPPFVAPAAAGVLVKHMTETPRPLGEHGIALPPGLESIVMQMLAKSRRDRPANAGEVARQLRAASHADTGPLAPSRRAETATSVSETTTRLSPRLDSGPLADRRTAGVPAPITEADRLVAQGVQAFNRFGASGGAAAKSLLDEAKVYLTRALALDPNNARGLCAMGNLYSVMGGYGLAPKDEALGRGRELIFAALAADDQCAEVHCSMGKIALYYDDDFHAAERHIRRAVELDPAEPESLRLLSIVYKILGRAEDAVAAARMATRHTPDVAPLWNTFGDALLAAGRNAEAVDVLKRAIALLPGYGPALERLERAHAALGEFDRALETRRSRMRLAGQRDRADLLDAEAHTLGASAAIRLDMRRELDGLLREAATADPFFDNLRRNIGDRIASGYAELGDWHEAMDWVQRGYERRPGRLRRMLTDLPIDYRGLAVDPRYAGLLRVAGLEDLL